jgi:sulfur carrier protein
MKETAMTQAAVQTNIRVNGQDEPLGVPTLAALLEEKAVDTGQRGIAVALNGAIVPRAAWPRPGL